MRIWHLQDINSTGAHPPCAFPREDYARWGWAQTQLPRPLIQIQRRDRAWVLIQKSSARWVQSSDLAECMYITSLLQTPIHPYKVFERTKSTQINSKFTSKKKLFLLLRWPYPPYSHKTVPIIIIYIVLTYQKQVGKICTQITTMLLPLHEGKDTLNS